jgi:hypothetical protein
MKRITSFFDRPEGYAIFAVLIYAAILAGIVYLANK